MTDIRDSKLVGRLKKGEKAALEEFYDQYSPVLLAVAMRYLPAREDAEDVMHESLLKVLKALDRFNPRFSGSLEAWMKKITVNTSLNFLRNLQSNKRINGWLSYDIPDIEEEDENQDELPEQMEPELVIRLIGELPEGYRTVLNLYVFENFTHKEIAEALGIAENTSKSQLSKARALLRKKLLAYSNLNPVVKR